MFGKSVRLFTLFGFPVRIDVSWLLVALLAAWSLAAGLGGAGSEVRAAKGRPFLNLWSGRYTSRSIEKAR
jgi:hypothetical protein